MAGRPVTMTVGTIWSFKVEPQSRLRLTFTDTLVQAIVNVARVIFGVVYFNDCPQQPNIPMYLLGQTLIMLLMTPFVTFSFERNSPQLQEPPRGCKACLQCLIALFGIMWFLAGAVWVFSIYQPNYDPAAADGLYCDKTLYTFVFWNVVLEILAIFVSLANLCKGVLCCVLMSPAPANTNFYRSV